MQRRPRPGALAALLSVSILAACGGDQSRSAAEIEAEVASQLEDSGLPAGDAECVAGVIVAEIGAEELEDVDFNAEEPPRELEEEIAEATRAAIDECDLLGDAESTGETGDG